MKPGELHSALNTMALTKALSMTVEWNETDDPYCVLQRIKDGRFPNNAVYQEGMPDAVQDMSDLDIADLIEERQELLFVFALEISVLHFAHWKEEIV
jgi:hypothetical protein